MSKRLLNVLLPAATSALFVAVWYVVRFSMGEEMQFLLPSPGDILTALHENAGSLARAALNTTAPLSNRSLILPSEAEHNAGGNFPGWGTR